MIYSVIYTVICKSSSIIEHFFNKFSLIWLILKIFRMSAFAFNTPPPVRRRPLLTNPLPPWADVLYGWPHVHNLWIGNPMYYSCFPIVIFSARFYGKIVVAAPRPTKSRAKKPNRRVGLLGGTLGSTVFTYFQKFQAHNPPSFKLISMILFYVLTEKFLVRFFEKNGWKKLWFAW